MEVAVMFDGIPSYYKYRTLKLAADPLEGEDVYALQVCLGYVNESPIVADGVYGPKTDAAVRSAQTLVGLISDGKVGTLTWHAFANRLVVAARKRHLIAAGLLYGIVEHESGFRGGMYSDIRSDGTFDAGMCQRNSKYHRLQDAFNPVLSVELLASTVKTNYDDYVTADNNLSELRCWGLAAGSWNAPYYANYLAGVEPSAKPGELARQKLEEYIDDVTTYLRV